MRVMYVVWLAALCFACDLYPAWLEPRAAGPDFPVQGEYEGESGGAQVIALGAGSFRVVHLRGGLPGAGWDGETRIDSEGRREPETDVVRFEDGTVIENGVLLVGGATLVRIERTSPTLGASPPPGAVVVVGGAGGRVHGRVQGRLDSRGLLSAGATSEDRFQDANIHVEFRTPYMPGASGQARGNSGVYIQDRYEVQILDSFGLSGESNECGALYEFAKPDVNMTYPPLSWQTYDIEFTAARFDADGEKTAPARISVRHNGVSIHDDLELSAKTGRGDAEGPEPGPLSLQDHGNPVFYRNVWVLPTGS
jgi:hypothetical protein